MVCVKLARQWLVVLGSLGVRGGAPGGGRGNSRKTEKLQKRKEHCMMFDGWPSAEPNPILFYFYFFLFIFVCS